MSSLLTQAQANKKRKRSTMMDDDKGQPRKHQANTLLSEERDKPSRTRRPAWAPQDIISNEESRSNSKVVDPKVMWVVRSLIPELL
jgi:hypothetical protein